MIEQGLRLLTKREHPDRGDGKCKGPEMRPFGAFSKTGKELNMD